MTSLILMKLISRTCLYLTVGSAAAQEELDSPAVELGREQNWVKPEQPGTSRVATGAHTADEASVAGAGSTNSLCPASGVGMLNKNLAMALGALTGLVGLVGMLRLAAGAFSRGMSIRSCSPWCRGSPMWPGAVAMVISVGDALVVLLLDLVGCVLVWLFVLGPVVALGCSLARSSSSG